MNNPFLNDMSRKLNSLHPGASDRIDRIDELPDPVGRSIVNTLLQQACQSQHIGSITSARQAMLAIPPVWLSRVLHDAISDVVDLNDEWEYRRLIELLKELNSGLLRVYLDYGMESGSGAIHEAATDLNNC
jgi:hypothetical protein